jgi:hypothetical protein
MKIDVPYYSQHADITDESWKNRSCGIVALKILLETTSADDTSLDDLLLEGIKINGFGPSGWKHQKLVEIADIHGVDLERKEYRSEDVQRRELMLGDAIETFTGLIESSKPVIVSAVKNFSEESKFHLVVLVGYEQKGTEVAGFYYHDPDAQNMDDGAYIYVEIGTFKKYFRGLAILPKIC